MTHGAMVVDMCLSLGGKRWKRNPHRKETIVVHVQRLGTTMLHFHTNATHSSSKSALAGLHIVDTIATASVYIPADDRYECSASVVCVPTGTLTIPMLIPFAQLTTSVKECKLSSHTIPRHRNPVYFIIPHNR